MKLKSPLSPLPIWSLPHFLRNHSCDEFDLYHCIPFLYLSIHDMYLQKISSIILYYFNVNGFLLDISSLGNLLFSLLRCV